MSLKNTLLEESDWFNTSQVVINFEKPICLVTAIYLSQQNFIEKNLQATQFLSSETFSLSELQTKADLIFQVITEPNCGPVKFRFTDDSSVPLTFDAITETFTFSPALSDADGISISL